MLCSLRRYLAVFNSVRLHSACFGEVGQFSAVSIYFKWSLAIYCSVLQSMVLVTVSGSFRQYLAVYGNIWQYSSSVQLLFKLTVFRSVCLQKFTAVFSSVRQYSSILDRIRQRLAVYWSSRQCLVPFDSVRWHAAIHGNWTSWQFLFFCSIHTAFSLLAGTSLTITWLLISEKSIVIWKCFRCDL